MEDTVDFISKFATLNQKETRKLIKDRACTQEDKRLSQTARDLLKYLVSCSWVPATGRKHTATVSRKAMAKDCRVSVAVIDYSLGVLVDKELVTVREDGVDVHCEPMRNWKTVREVEADKTKRRRAGWSLCQAKRRAREWMPDVELMGCA